MKEQEKKEQHKQNKLNMIIEPTETNERKGIKIIPATQYSRLTFKTANPNHQKGYISPEYPIIEVTLTNPKE